MMKAGSYALWLMPERKLSHRLRDLILHLSRRYSTPLFPPHVTLLGRLEGEESEMQSKALTLASCLDPMTLQLSAVDGWNEFFRSLFVRVDCSQSLLEAHRKALEVFGIRDEPPFVPHLSLIYSNLPSSIKREIIGEIGSKLQLRFMANQLHLFSTSGDPSWWQPVCAYPFGMPTA